MRTDQRRLTFLSLRLLYPRLNRFSNEIAEFLPGAREQYPFEHFHMDGDSGGVIETEGKRRLEIERETLYYQERVTDDISVVKRGVTDLLTLAFLHFEIPIVIVNQIELRQRWPMDLGSGSVGDAMREHALKLEPEHFAPLGQLQNVGLHLVGTVNPEQGDDGKVTEAGPAEGDETSAFHWHLEVDPYQRIQEEFHIELRTHFSQPLEEAGQVADAIEASHSFLDDNVGKFISGFMP